MNDSPQQRWDRRMDRPLAAASMLFLTAYAVRVLALDLPETWRTTCLIVIGAAWAVFLLDYAVRLRLSGQGPRRFVRTHLLDTIVLLIPLLRPVRMFNLYDRVQRRRRDGPRLTLYARVMVYAGLTVLLLGFAGALTVYHHEHDAPGATIRTFGDAIWWACETLATVGYGDVVPVTPFGRVIAVGMMACGLALLGAVTGSFSSWLIQTFAMEDEKRPPGDSPGAS
ncbi:potassium channel family protein [Streptomyces sp.]|uniref:potassium channel family protein n=1 Tax=Streptomyces sp. TaxID=1931 RepID=UPI002F95041D